MKRLYFPLLVLAFLVPSGALRAQSSGVVPFVGGGLAMGTGRLSKDTNNGWLAFGGVDVPLDAWPGLGLGVMGSFASIPYASGGFDEATQVTTVSAELSYVIGSESTGTVKPYVRAGAGVQVHRYDPGTTLYSAKQDTRAAVTGGAGLRFDLSSSANALVGAHFQSGEDGGFLGIHAGVAFPVGGSR
jgi:hypothetical protein